MMEAATGMATAPRVSKAQAIERGRVGIPETKRNAMNSAADSFRLLLLSAPFGKLLRHLLNAGGGYLAAYGIETGNTAALMGTLAAFLFTGFWSWLAKRGLASTPNGEDVKTVCGILASAAVAAVSGVLAEQGLDANQPDEALQGIAALFFTGNLALSKLTRPDVEAQALAAIKREFGGKIPAFILAGFCLLALPACSITREQWSAAGKQAGVEVADISIALAMMQIQSARAELDAAALNGAKPSELFTKRAALILAEQGLKAAQRAANRERAKLDAKQPRNMQPPRDVPACFQPTPQETRSAGTAQDVPSGGSTARRSATFPKYGDAIAAQLRTLPTP